MKNHRECKACGKAFPTPPSSRKVFCSSACRCCQPINVRHGESYTRLHAIWCGMKSRCSGQTSYLATRYYQDKGIVVCEEWRCSYETFRDWAQANGYQDNLEIDRIDGNGNYEPSNCRWVSRCNQMRNTRIRVQANKTSQYRGVQRLHQGGSNPWRAFICVNGKMKHLGVYKTEREAAVARDVAAKEQFGEFAKLNLK